MMSLTLLLALSLLALMLMAIQLHCIRHRQKQAQKHDEVLYPFCQLRRDIMDFLYARMLTDPITLTTAEYASVRRLLDVLNHTIHNYSEHRTVMFDLRQVLKALQQYRHTLKQARPVDLTNDTEIQHIHKRFVRCCAKAFLAYTPLIRSEAVLRLALHLYRVRRQEYLLKAARQVREQKNYGGPLDTPSPA